MVAVVAASRTGSTTVTVARPSSRLILPCKDRETSYIILLKSDVVDSNFSRFFRSVYHSLASGNFACVEASRLPTMTQIFSLFAT